MSFPQRILMMQDAVMYNIRARWYAPKLMKWMSNDPLLFGAGDVNLGRFVGNDPINRVDPSGLKSCKDRGFGDCWSSCMLTLGSYYVDQAGGYIEDALTAAGIGYAVFGPTISEGLKKAIAQSVNNGKTGGVTGWTSIFSTTMLYLNYFQPLGITLPTSIGGVGVRTAAGAIGNGSLYAIEGLGAFLTGAMIGTGISCTADCLEDSNSW